MDRLHADTLRTFTGKAFEQVGVPGEDAKTVAELMIEADLQGSDGHGIFRLPQYIRRIQAGGVDKDVLFVEESAPELNEQIDVAYSAKYGRRYPASVASINSPVARTATIKLVPRDER